jgi:predicted SAM-dependent methyltransferase
MTLNMLNIGCGSKSHPSWVNVDLNPSDPSVKKIDILKPLPFNNNSFDVVYNSHLLEHVPKNGALILLNECFRIVKPKGIIRIVVPDFELLVRKYLEIVEIIDNGPPDTIFNYEWVKLMMLDQMVRNKSGGAMLEYLSQKIIPNEQFTIDFGGKEIEDLLLAVRTNKITSNKSNFLAGYLKKAAHPRNIREILLRIILGKEYKALQTGRFRNNGETHQWMYDKYSLRMILQQAGFIEIKKCSAAESLIADWKEYCLDTTIDGIAYKRESLYMEAIKPE